MKNKQLQLPLTNTIGFYPSDLDSDQENKIVFD